MKARIFSVSVLAALASAPCLAAASWTNSPIQTLLVQDGGTANHPGTVHVIMPTNSLYLPSCHTAPLMRFVIDLSRPAAKSQYAMLLAANVAKQNVTISLNESCLDGFALLRNVEIVQ